MYKKWNSFSLYKAVSSACFDSGKITARFHEKSLAHDGEQECVNSTSLSLCLCLHTQYSHDLCYS